MDIFLVYLDKALDFPVLINRVIFSVDVGNTHSGASCWSQDSCIPKFTLSGQLAPFPTHPIFSKDISPHVKFHPLLFYMFGTTVISKCIFFLFKVYKKHNLHLYTYLHLYFL